MLLDRGTIRFHILMKQYSLDRFDAGLKKHSPQESRIGHQKYLILTKHPCCACLGVRYAVLKISLSIFRMAQKYFLEAATEKEKCFLQEILSQCRLLRFVFLSYHYEYQSQSTNLVSIRLVLNRVFGLMN